MVQLTKLLSSELRNIADKIDAGNSIESEDSLISALECLAQSDKTQIMSKVEACKYMNMSRATFDAYIIIGLIPKGRKQVGLKELTWTKLDLDIAKYKIESR